jgi:hypothetical protein
VSCSSRAGMVRLGRACPGALPPDPGRLLPQPDAGTRGPQVRSRHEDPSVERGTRPRALVLCGIGSAGREAASRSRFARCL